MILQLLRHLYRSMVDSVCHALPIFNDIKAFFYQTNKFSKVLQLHEVSVFLYHVYKARPEASLAEPF